MNTHEVSADDLTLYAMRATDSAEASRIGEHLAGCGSCRAELQQINADLAALAMTVPQSGPSLEARERLLQEVREHERLSGSRRVSPGFFSFQRWWRVASAAALLFAIASGLLWTENARLRFQLTALRKTVHQLQEQQQQAQAAIDRSTQIMAMLNSRDAMRVTLVSTRSKPQPEAHAIYSREQGRLMLMASNLASVPEHMAYQLWILPKEGAPMSAGMFKPDANGNALMVMPKVPEVEAKGFALTVEPETGSPAPTSKPVLMGQAT